MIAELRDALRARFGSAVGFDQPLAGFTTYRIGGPATAVVTPRTVEDVQAAARLAAQGGVEWVPLGLGSNLLVDDEGVDAVVIRVGKPLAFLRRDAAAPEDWTLGAGLPTPLAAKKTAAAGLGGLHRLVGVPGTVGGGVRMNAGAHEQDFSQVVRWVDFIGADGSLARLPGDRIPWAYRTCGLGTGVVVAAGVRLEGTDPAVLQRDVRRHLRWRRAGTPFDRPCCGSVFRNPTPEEAAAADGAPTPCTAGRLIDAVGMKGFRVGGAEVSPMHANYIVNTGDATAADVREVIGAVHDAVGERFGIDLRLEVQGLGGVAAAERA